MILVRSQRIGKRGSAIRGPETVRVKNVGVTRLVFSELDLGVALRLALALLMYILKMRVDSHMLSGKRAHKIHNDILRLVQNLTAADPSVLAVVPPPVAMQTAPAQPIMAIKPALSTTSVSKSVVTPAGETSSVRTRVEFPRPKPSTPTWSEAPSGSILIEGINIDVLAKLTVKELQEFVRMAAPDTRHLFEDALMRAYRKQLIVMFNGPVSVKQETEDLLFPDFRLIYRPAQSVVLRRGVGVVEGGSDQRPYLDAYHMVRDYWHSLKRPQHFRIDDDAAVRLPLPESA